jgi:drug/metabolite transporter (DMT)-like permease
LAATAACICFGASVVATRFVVPQTTPIVLACIRYVIATACMLLVLGKQAFPAMPWRDRRAIAVLGVLFFGVFPWSFSASLTHLPATHVALIVATNPLVTLGFSAWRGVERITVPALAGQLLAFAGLVLALPPIAAVGDTGAAWIGYLEVGITVLCGAIYNVWSRPLLLQYNPLAVTAQSMGMGALALAPLALWQGVPLHTATITAGGWAAVAFLGSFGGALGFGLWIWALRRSTPSRVAVFMALNPITAIALGVLLLGEPLSLRLLLALAAVLGGIHLANRSR